MVSSPIVLDTGVLSSFLEAGWFENLQFLRPDFDLVATERVWNQEFAPHNGVGDPPEWLAVREPSAQMDSDVPGKLSNPDWSCVAIGELEDGTVITNDKPMKSVCEQRGVDARWGTKFMLRVFKKCGISQAEYNEGIPAYIEDLYLPPALEEELPEKSK